MKDEGTPPRAVDETTGHLRGVLALMMSALVDDPEQVQISVTEGESIVVFEIRTSVVEMGRVLGREGRNIVALRTLMSAIGAKHQRRVQVDVIEPDVV